jgi:hypothetical protein
MQQIRITWNMPLPGGGHATVTDESPPHEGLEQLGLSRLLSEIEAGLGVRIARAVPVAAGVGEIGISAYRVWHPETGVEGRLAIVPARPAGQATPRRQ